MIDQFTGMAVVDCLPLLDRSDKSESFDQVDVIATD
jgi:hypothetical protein